MNPRRENVKLEWFSDDDLWEHWIYSGREISQMMIRAGFADVRVFGDYAGSPYGPAAKRLVVVATKGA